MLVTSGQVNIVLGEGMGNRRNQLRKEIHVLPIYFVHSCRLKNNN